MVTFHTSQFAAIVTLLAASQNLDAPFTVTALHADRAEQAQKDILESLDVSAAAIAGNLVEHVAAGGVTETYEVVAGGEVDIGRVWLWVNSDGTNDRAYALDA